MNLIFGSTVVVTFIDECFYLKSLSTKLVDADTRKKFLYFVSLYDERRSHHYRDIMKLVDWIPHSAWEIMRENNFRRGKKGHFTFRDVSTAHSILTEENPEVVCSEQEKLEWCRGMESYDSCESCTCQKATRLADKIVESRKKRKRSASTEIQQGEGES